MAVCNEKQSDPRVNERGTLLSESYVSVCVVPLQRCAFAALHISGYVRIEPL